MPEKSIYGGSEKEYTSRPKDMPAFLSYERPQEKAYEPPKKTYEPPKKAEQRPADMPDFLTYTPPKKPEPKKIQEKVTPLSWMDDKQAPIVPKKKVKEPSWLDEPSVYSPDTVKAPFLQTGSVLQTAAYYWNRNFPGAVAEVDQTRKEWIQPTDSWFEKKLKDVVITTLAGGKLTIHTAIQTGVSMTLENAGAVIAATVANGNDLFRTILNMPKLSVNEKADIMDEVYEPTVYGTMALLESTGFRGFRAMNPFPTAVGTFGTKMTTSMAKAKMQFEFNNAIKSVNKVWNNQKTKNRGTVATIKDMNDFTVKQAIINPIVKKDIQALAIKTFEQNTALTKGPFEANRIANQLRIGSGIRTVAPLSVGAAATPKELLPAPMVKEIKPAPQLGEPFFNPVEKVINELPEIVSVNELEQKLSTKKLQRVLMGTQLNNKIGELKSQNQTMVTKKELVDYVNKNPWQITIKVLDKSDVLPEFKKEYDIKLKEVTSGFNGVNSIYNEILYNAYPKKIKEGEIKTIDENFLKENEIFQNTKVTEPRVFDEILKTYITGIKENLPGYNFKDLEIGKFEVMEMITGHQKSIIEKSIKNTIMLSLGYRDSGSIAPSNVAGEFTTYEKFTPEPGATFNRRPMPEVMAMRKNWVEELFENFENRTGHEFNLADFEIADPQLLDETLTSIVYRLEGNDFPDWNKFTNVLRSDKGYTTEHMPTIYEHGLRETIAGGAETFPSYTEITDKLSVSTRRVNEIKRKSKEKYRFQKFEKTGTRPYIYIDRPHDFEVGGATFDKGENKGNWTELRVHTNKLTGYPVYGDVHFSAQSDPNMLGWILGYHRPTLTSGKYKGSNVFSLEEAQSIDPISEFPAPKEGETLGASLKEIMAVSGPQFGSPVYGSFTSPVKVLETKKVRGKLMYKVVSKKDFDAIDKDWTQVDDLAKWIDGKQLRKEFGKGGIGQADWARKILWSNIRYAYDNNMDFITIPTGNTMNFKKKDQPGIGELYGTVIPNIVKKLGFKVYEVPMEDMGIIPPKGWVAEDFKEFYMENYGDDKVNVIDLRDKEKVFEILKVPQPVASLEQQTEQLLRYA